MSWILFVLLCVYCAPLVLQSEESHPPYEYEFKPALPAPEVNLALPEPESAPAFCTNTPESIFDNPWAWINTIWCGVVTVWSDINARPS